MSTTLRIGTRGSPLALAQANETRRRLASAHTVSEDRFEIVVIRTSGDRIQDRPLAEAGGKGLFTKEIEEALQAEAIDVAVHSMKDVETRLPDGLVIAAVLPREAPEDAFISLQYPTLEELPRGARVGTSSLRRAAQIRAIRPDLEIVEFRGNVETRLAKLAAGVADATFLAVAGLRRLGQAGRITAVMPADVMLPAVAQGAVGLQIRAGDRRTAELVGPLDHASSALAVSVERAFLARLDGSCRTPIAGLARSAGQDAIAFDGMILSKDGRRVLRTSHTGPANEAVARAVDAAGELLRQAGSDFFV